MSDESSADIHRATAVMTAMWVVMTFAQLHLWGWSNAVELMIIGSVLFGTMTVLFFLPLERLGDLHGT